MSGFFLTTERIGFRTWTAEDLPLALALWGDPQVTKPIDARTTLGRPGARTPVARDCDPAGPRHSVLAHLSPEQLRTSRLRGTPTVQARRRDSRNWGPPSRAALGPRLRHRGGAG